MSQSPAGPLQRLVRWRPLFQCVNPWIVGARALARGHKVEGVPLRILEAPIGPEATERNAGSAQGRLGCSSIRHPQRDMVWLA